MKKLKKKNITGFTLVEMIVVLVVLAILAAIAVPTFMGYIKKAKENPAIEECRLAVQAAQIKATELYGENTFTADGFLTNYRDEIMANADSTGTIESINFSIKDEAVIDTLIYVSDREIRVLYDRDGEPLYQIQKFTVKNAQGVYDYAEYLSKDAAIQFDPGNYQATKDLQALFKKKNEGKLPVISEDEQLILKGYKSSGDFSTVKWKPMYASNGEVILTADTKGEKDTNAMSCMVYYKGSYYVCMNSSGYLASEFVLENAFDVEWLEGELTTGSRNHYVKVEKQQ